MDDKSQKNPAHCECCSRKEGAYSKRRSQLFTRIDGLFSGKPILAAIFLTPLAFLGAATDYTFSTTGRVPLAQSSQVQEASLKSSDDPPPASLPQVGHTSNEAIFILVYKFIQLTATVVWVYLSCLTNDTSGTYRMLCALSMAMSAAEFAWYLAASGI